MASQIFKRPHKITFTWPFCLIKFEKLYCTLEEDIQVPRSSEATSYFQHDDQLMTNLLEGQANDPSAIKAYNKCCLHVQE